ncbi:FAD-dependent 5-carboxymethylaminomethyl-2-thiouridine(34) oxidoreductase MnmC, partial [Variovorax paradoxus]|nr:FAD-dependent 5-carboxymethylaminomethyl-2-thiouridine(34) oxidoreductase MnmC [Variovorax paradoxus]
AVARFARRGTRVASWTVARPVRDALAQFGFQVRKAPGLPPKRDALQGVFDPPWQIRRRAPAAAPIAVPGVIGAGLAGAAVAASLARRGWQVRVFEAGARGAAGASGLPVGVLAPHVSPDDALLSRLTRAGVRATWQQLEALLAADSDWRACGVLERRAAGQDRLPVGWTADGPNESWHASAAQLRDAGLPDDAPAFWHARAGWVKPARLVDAWLAQPGIALETERRVARIEAVQQGRAGWALHDAQGTLLAEAERVVIAAGFESRVLAPALALQPVRGQVAWGRMAAGMQLPRVPINGDGHLIAHVPDPEGALWLTGATFDRDSSDRAPRDADTASNRERLARLHPDAALRLAPAFESGGAKAWAGVRCASGDRRPLVGPLAPVSHEGVWLCTAMGSRGLSFAVLCAELLAAHWHGEPLPLPASLAQALDARRALRGTAQMLTSAR